MKFVFALAGVLAISATTAFASEDDNGGDIAEGETAFRKCAACHQVAVDGEILAGKGKTGPNLYAIAGRTAGAEESFTKYSDSLVAAGEAGLVWDEEQFEAFVADPRKYLQAYLDDSKARSKMSFKLKDGADDIWAYLESLGPEAATN